MSSSSKGQVLGVWWTKKVVLNHNPAPAEAPAEVSASDLARRLRLCMLKLKGSFMTPDGSGVDYKSLKASEVFADYVKMTAALRNTNLSDLDQASRKGFLINIYNCLCIHALAEGLLGSFPGGSLSRLKLYASSSYNIGGQVYSLNDIENGVLRGNKPSAAPWAKVPFASSKDAKGKGEDDPRLGVVLDTCDPRIHFALNCGANSCPPIGVYDVDNPEKLDSQLHLASKGFLSSAANVQLDAATGIAKLSMLFKWYKSDFGATDMDIVRFVGANGDEKTKARVDAFLAAVAGDGDGDGKGGVAPTLTVQWIEYDWGLNSSSKK